MGRVKTTSALPLLFKYPVSMSHSLCTVLPPCGSHRSRVTGWKGSSIIRGL
jgi:hypothetical protein